MIIQLTLEDHYGKTEEDDEYSVNLIISEDKRDRPENEGWSSAMLVAAQLNYLANNPTLMEVALKDAPTEEVWGFSDQTSTELLV